MNARSRFEPYSVALRRCGLLLTVLALPSCEGKPSPSATSEALARLVVTNRKPLTADERISAARGSDLRVLFMGNSHSLMFDLPAKVRALLEASAPGTTAYCELAPESGFLDMHWGSDLTQEALNGLEWTHVVLQAQRYSTSGRYEYSTEAATQFIQRITEIGGVPVMYPEWRQRDRADEGERVQALHESIARGTEARVAPVGMAWDRVIARFPELNLYAPDGNHASEIGAYVTACTLVATITERSPVGLPNLCQTPLADDRVRGIQQCCWEALREFPATPVAAPADH